MLCVSELLVLVLALKKFSLGSPVSLCPQKSTLLNSNSMGICHSLPWMPEVFSLASGEELQSPESERVALVGERVLFSSPLRDSPSRLNSVAPNEKKPLAPRVVTVVIIQSINDWI